MRAVVHCSTTPPVLKSFISSRKTTLQLTTDLRKSWFQSGEFPISGNVVAEQQGEAAAAELLDRAEARLMMALPAPATPARILPTTGKLGDVVVEV
jgi:hypothetical protein